MTEVVPDNFRFDITAAGETLLRQSIELACAGRSVATHWKVEEDRRPPRLILAWDQPSGEDWHRLMPSPPSILRLQVAEWLQLQDYGPAPDLDGSVAPGFRIYNEQFGRIGDEDHAFVAIEPVWAEYHQ